MTMNLVENSPRMGSGRDHPQARSEARSQARCLVVDDHRLVAQAIGGLLSEICGLQLQAVCTSVREAIETIRLSCPDLMILDLHLPGEDWRDVATLFVELNPRGSIVFLTGMSAEFVPPAGLEPQVLAVVDKARAWQDLASVIHGWLADRSETPTELPLEQLTPRELRVFLCLGRGLLNKEIAHELGLSVPTIETYRKNLSQKLGISGPELVRAAALHRCVWEAS